MSRHENRRIVWILVLVLLNLRAGSVMKDDTGIGIFESSSDIGVVKHPGCSLFDPAMEQYRLRGSGTNMWFGEDELHFLWKRVTGDFIIDTRVEWIGKGTHPHRKAGLSVRESMETGSRHISAEFHGGDGLMSMQYRLEKDSSTLEQSSKERYLSVLRLEKTGKTFRMLAAKPGDFLKLVGEIEMPFDSTALTIGLFVCSHDSDTVEEAVFSNTRVTRPVKPDFVPYQDYLGSRLEILEIESGLKKSIYQSRQPFEAPNWSKDGRFLVVNSQGRLYRIPVQGGEWTEIRTGFAISNNNDHGFSPDGRMLAISHHASDRPAGENSVIYTVPVSGGKPRQITENSPSYWHGWSPDGKTLIYTAKRNGRWNLFGIPSSGGREYQITNNEFLDDGSDFSPDGRNIWFNSNRTGRMEIWRMKQDGSEPVQITDDAFQNWFPHPSPDGRWVVFLTYPPEVDSWDHPYYKPVMLRLIDLTDLSIRVVAYLYGGQGTINVPSWSPDSKRFAFVSNTDLF